MDMAKILVVGGAGGVGSALVDMLVERGDDVEVTVLNSSEAAQVSARHGEKVGIHAVDLGDADAALAALKSAIGGMDRLDAVAVCAAMAPVGPIETTPLSVFRKTIEVNTIAHVAIFQAALPALRNSKGRIVFISSMAGQTSMPFIGAYTASKWGLEGVADIMRQEVANQGVKITLIEPGGIKTPMVDNQLAQVKQVVETLDPDVDARYGHLYRGFLKAAGDSNASGASTPAQVAAVLIEALDAAEPETRYIAGDDAKQLIGLSKQVSDREMDGIFAGLFAGNA